MPELQDSSAPQWPYVVLGTAFALYGIALFLRGGSRRREEEMVGGGEPAPRDGFALALALAGPCLGLATIALIAFE